MDASPTIYTPLVKRIKSDILSGVFAPGQKLGTEVGLAAEAGISRSSVREAMDDLIAEGLVERRPGKGIFARKAAPEARSVEIIVPELSAMWASMVHGAQDAGAPQGVKVQIYNANRDFEADMRAIRMLPDSGVAGAIIGAMHQQRMNEALVRLWQTGFPFVLCDQRMQDIDVPSVVFDNHRAGYLATQELIALGHRRIAYIGYEVTGLSGSRFDGYRDALGDAGIAIDRSLVLLQPVDPDLPRHAPDRAAFLAALPTRANRPTAIVFHSIGLAASGSRLLREQGLRIPDDLGVVAIGDVRESEIVEPTPSLVALPFREMGSVALDILLRRLAEPDGAIEHRILPVTWIPRHSTRQMPAE
ncbi:MAG: GntR family transcriptional regulator [Kiritimatiellae bacterium]|nr:GntR family transcriptional regulator [Kiritimatiellia bacterium]